MLYRIRGKRFGISLWLINNPKTIITVINTTACLINQYYKRWNERHVTDHLTLGNKVNMMTSSFPTSWWHQNLWWGGRVKVTGDVNRQSIVPACSDKGLTWERWRHHTGRVNNSRNTESGKISYFQLPLGSVESFYLWKSLTVYSQHGEWQPSWI